MIDADEKQQGKMEEILRSAKPITLPPLRINVYYFSLLPLSRLLQGHCRQWAVDRWQWTHYHGLFFKLTPTLRTSTLLKLQTLLTIEGISKNLHSSFSAGEGKE